MTQNTMPTSQNSVPAPYELNTPQIQAYAGGGSTSRHKGLEAAHVSPHELSIMDHLQGGAKIDKDGVRSYGPLESLIKNPHIVHSIHKHHHNRKRHAQGGYSPSMEHLREGGRNGDTELALIGPHTHHLFNQLAGHATRNPNTGHPEYFDLGGALSGLWDTVKGGMGNLFGGAPEAIKQVAQTAAPSLIPMAQQYLGDKGGAFGQIAGQMLPGMADKFLGPQSQNMNPMYRNLGESIGRGAQSYGQGASPQQAFGHGVQNFGNQMGGGFGNAIQQAGQSFGQGNSFGDSMRHGAQRGFNEMGGRQGLYNTALNVGMGGLQGGMNGARQAAGNEMNQYAQRMMPRPANQQRYPQQQYSPPQQQFNPYEQDQGYPYQVEG